MATEPVSRTQHPVPLDENEIELTAMRVVGADGVRWVSTLSYNDTGGGAREVVYLKSIEIVSPNSSR